MAPLAAFGAISWLPSPSLNRLKYTSVKPIPQLMPAFTAYLVISFLSVTPREVAAFTITIPNSKAPTVSLVKAPLTMPSVSGLVTYLLVAAGGLLAGIITGAPPKMIKEIILSGDRK